jgi:hypothetical protein
LIDIKLSILIQEKVKEVKTMDLELLKNKIFERRKTYLDCAEVLKMTVTTFSHKINGRSDFKIKEVVKLVEYLNLTKEESYALVFETM